MFKFIKFPLILVIILYSIITNSTTLISNDEALLPDATPINLTRGILRGPGVKLISPSSDNAVISPIDFKVLFEPRGDNKIKVDMVKVEYLKNPVIDLTPRMNSFISNQGINFPKADIPPGKHTFRLTVQDQDGRETHQIFTVNVFK